MKSEPRYCEICHSPIERGRRGDECQACADWLAYWENLTPAERAAEQAMMDDYVNLHAGEPG